MLKNTIQDHVKGYFINRIEHNGKKSPISFAEKSPTPSLKSWTMYRLQADC